tara:strand:+ start:197 stop:610 length:414 start_codon:yes stop_codon:yes gene_type:complete
MKVTRTELLQIIKEEMEAELSEDKYATEDDRPLGTSRSLMSDKDARRVLKMAKMLSDMITPDQSMPAEARALASDIYGILEKGVTGGISDGPEGSGPSADMEDYESDYRDPERAALKGASGKRMTKAQLDMMKDYDI